MNSRSFGYCTIKLANDLKFLTKTFTEQTDLKQKQYHQFILIDQTLFF